MGIGASDFVAGVMPGGSSDIDRMVEAVEEKGGNPQVYETPDIALLSTGSQIDQGDVKVGFGGYLYGLDESETPEEKVARLYREHGESFPRELEGGFRVALYDSTKDYLYLATDVKGSKPVYFSKGEKLVFGGYITTLLANPRVDNRIDRGAVIEHLNTCFNIYSGNRTLLKDVKSMHNSSVLRYGDRSVDRNIYWEVYNSPKLSLPESQTAYVMEELFREGVEKSVEKADEINILLSGGFDSTFLTAFMDENVEKPVKTYTWAFIDEQVEEAKEAADLLGVDNEVVKVPQRLPRSELLWEMELPLTSLNFSRTTFVRDIGVEETFSGMSDSITFPVGLKNFRHLNRLRRLKPLFRAADKINLDNLFVRLARRWDERIGNGFDILTSPYQSAVLTNMRVPRQKKFSELVPESEDPYRLERKVDEQWDLEPRGFDENFTYLMLRERNINHVSTVTKPVRHYDPFTYKPLLEFSFRIPMQQKKNRRFARKIAEDYLPREVVEKEPSGLGSTLQKSLNRSLKSDREEYRRTVRRFLSRGLLREGKAEEFLLKDVMSRPTFHKTFMSEVFILEKWIQTFVEREDPWTSPGD
ncbi:MAG: asparagine synthase-related protein [Candidatus Nanohaloarchaea archaeon]